MTPKITACIATHNPHPVRLRRTLRALDRQTLARTETELVIVDNGSTPPLDWQDYQADYTGDIRVVREPTLGLTAARRAALRVVRSPFAVLVDDDNELAPDYLARSLAAFARHPRVGALGGPSIAEFEVPPAPALRRFLPLLALRDLGPKEQVSAGLRPSGSAHNQYPEFAPIGAGMALRRPAWEAWLNRDRSSQPSDRRGGELTSGGDNDIVLTLMEAGWEVAYCPELSLTHLIPATRVDARYLARLNRAVQCSWMQVLSAHAANPWPPISTFSASLRKTRAWWTHRGWRDGAPFIEWQGACGHFDGRVTRKNVAR